MPQTFTYRSFHQSSNHHIQLYQCDTLHLEKPQSLSDLGGHARHTPPPKGPDSFVFDIQFFNLIFRNVTSPGVHAPPPPRGPRPPLREILDPPLSMSCFFSSSKFHHWKIPHNFWPLIKSYRLGIGGYCANLIDVGFLLRKGRCGSQKSSLGPKNRKVIFLNPVIIFKHLTNKFYNNWRIYLQFQSYGHQT